MILLTAAQICNQALAAGIRPEPDLLVSEWADRYRILTQVSSAEPGRWSTDRTPYLREIMDNLSPSSPVFDTTVMKGAQTGGTEAGNNWVGYVIHQAPGPMLYVQPTVESVKKYSKMRIAPMFEGTPVLAERIKSARKRDSGNTLLMKEFSGGVLILTGANSGVGLRSMPARFLFEDEIDAYPQDVDGEGGPLELAEKRTSTFRNRKIYRVSTPTILELSPIYDKYLAGDQRKYFVPCPYCEEMQFLVWRMEDGEPGGIVWPQERPQEAKYQCRHCGKLIDEYRKTWMFANGEWRPQATCDPRVRSYHLPSYYSPYGWPGSSWPALSEKWMRGHKNPTKLKVFMNTEMGWPFEDRSARRVDEHILLNRKEAYGAFVPNNVAAITLGADVQGDRIECELVGWGRDEESWSLGYYVLTGDATRPEVWARFDKILTEQYENEAGISLPVKAACVDANFSTQAVVTFCGQRFNRRVWACRGMAGQRPIWPHKPGKSKYNNQPLFTLGVDAAKSVIYARLKVDKPGPSYCHFPLREEYDRDHFEQLTAEVCVTVYDKALPRNVWKKKNAGARNEALDCRGYAYAALCGLQAGGFRLNREADRMQELVEASAGEPRKVRAALGSLRLPGPAPVYSSDPYLS